MNIKFLLSALLPFLVLHMQAKNQEVTYKSHTIFSDISQPGLPPDWSVNSDSHRFTVDSLPTGEGMALKICGARDSIVPSVLTLTALPVNRENEVTFSMRVKTQSANDSLLIRARPAPTPTSRNKATTPRGSFSIQFPIIQVGQPSALRKYCTLFQTIR